jgi:hypothetical protein
MLWCSCDAGARPCPPRGGLRCRHRAPAMALSLTSLQSLPKLLSIASLSEKRPEGYPKAHCPPRSYSCRAAAGLPCGTGSRARFRMARSPRWRQAPSNRREQWPVCGEHAVVRAVWGAVAADGMVIVLHRHVGNGPQPLVQPRRPLCPSWKPIALENGSNQLRRRAMDAVVSSVREGRRAGIRGEQAVGLLD